MYIKYIYSIYISHAYKKELTRGPKLMRALTRNIELNSLFFGFIYRLIEHGIEHKQ